MKKKLITKQVSDAGEIREFFDQTAEAYREAHGNARKLLRYRLSVLEQFAGFSPEQTVLDIGCGNGHHLFSLTDKFDQGIGIDFSAGMIRRARDRLKNFPQRHKLEFRVDDSEKLATVADCSVSRVICMGAFEHMLNKKAVLRNVYRVLKPGGRFVLLTLNGAYFWYTFLAPRLQLPTKHFSTDTFLNRKEIESLLTATGFMKVRTGTWRFIPKGDMPGWSAFFLEIFDRLGMILGIEKLRGGIVVSAEKPEGRNNLARGETPGK